MKKSALKSRDVNVPNRSLRWADASPQKQTKKESIDLGKERPDFIVRRVYHIDEPPTAVHSLPNTSFESTPLSLNSGSSKPKFTEHDSPIREAGIKIKPPTGARILPKRILSDLSNNSQSVPRKPSKANTIKELKKVENAINPPVVLKELILEELDTSSESSNSKENNVENRLHFIVNQDKKDENSTNMIGKMIKAVQKQSDKGDNVRKVPSKVVEIPESEITLHENIEIIESSITNTSRNQQQNETRKEKSVRNYEIGLSVDKRDESKLSIPIPPPMQVSKSGEKTAINELEYMSDDNNRQNTATSFDISQRNVENGEEMNSLTKNVLLPNLDDISPIRKLSPSKALSKNKRRSPIQNQTKNNLAISDKANAIKELKSSTEVPSVDIEHESPKRRRSILSQLMASAEYQEVILGNTRQVSSTKSNLSPEIGKKTSKNSPLKDGSSSKVALPALERKKQEASNTPPTLPQKQRSPLAEAIHAADSIVKKSKKAISPKVSPPGAPPESTVAIPPADQVQQLQALLQGMLKTLNSSRASTMGTPTLSYPSNEGKTSVAPEISLLQTLAGALLATKNEQGNLVPTNTPVGSRNGSERQEGKSKSAAVLDPGPRVSSNSEKLVKGVPTPAGSGQTTKRDGEGKAVAPEVSVSATVTPSAIRSYPQNAVAKPPPHPTSSSVPQSGARAPSPLVGGNPMPPGVPIVLSGGLRGIQGVKTAFTPITKQPLPPSVVHEGEIALGTSGPVAGTGSAAVPEEEVEGTIMTAGLYVPYDPYTHGAGLRGHGGMPYGPGHVHVEMRRPRSAPITLLPNVRDVPVHSYARTVMKDMCVDTTDLTSAEPASTPRAVHAASRVFNGSSNQPTLMASEGPATASTFPLIPSSNSEPSPTVIPSGAVIDATQSATIAHVLTTSESNLKSTADTAATKPSGASKDGLQRANKRSEIEIDEIPLGEADLGTDFDLDFGADAPFDDFLNSDEAPTKPRLLRERDRAKTVKPAEQNMQQFKELSESEPESISVYDSPPLNKTFTSQELSEEAPFFPLPSGAAIAVTESEEAKMERKKRSVKLKKLFLEDITTVSSYDEDAAARARDHLANVADRDPLQESDFSNSLMRLDAGEGTVTAPSFVWEGSKEFQEIISKENCMHRIVTLKGKRMVHKYPPLHNEILTLDLAFPPSEEFLNQQFTNAGSFLKMMMGRPIHSRRGGKYYMLPTKYEEMFEESGECGSLMKNKYYKKLIKEASTIKVPSKNGKGVQSTPACSPYFIHKFAKRILPEVESVLENGGIVSTMTKSSALSSTNRNDEHNSQSLLALGNTQSSRNMVEIMDENAPVEPIALANVFSTVSESVVELNEEEEADLSFSSYSSESDYIPGGRQGGNGGRKRERTFGRPKVNGGKRSRPLTLSM